MLKRIGVLAVVAMMIFVVDVYAAQGNGVHDGTGPITDIYSGEPVVVSGTVADINSGCGIVVDDGTEMVTIYGIGPYWFWEKSGVDRPQVGEEIIVDAYNVTFSDGSSKIIATKITVSGINIELRDPETGAPLWRHNDNSDSGCKGNCPCK